MVKLAIVGSSHLTEAEEYNARKLIIELFSKYKNPIIVSGGANGIDTIAKEEAELRGLKTIIKEPLRKEKKYFLKRNREIAKECDELVCFVVKTRDKRCYHHVPPQDHQRTGGCYTSKYAREELNKKTETIKIESFI